MSQIYSMASLPNRFPAYLVRQDAGGAIQSGMETLRIDELPPGEVLIEVAWSSINFKDSLAARGHKGVVRQLPHVPGVDAAGRVVASEHSDWRPGQKVIVTGNELGAGQWGGWSRYVRVPASWIVELPETLTLYESMVYGTAGFTAVQCVRRLEQHEVRPDQGPILVTGATGGVGCLAVVLLAKLGYHVVAVSGKRDRWDWLKNLGATDVIDRNEVMPPDSAAPRPLSSARWAGVVDTVGGETLAAAVRATQAHGCVAACGNVGGADLALTVYPFILRGIALAGVTSQNTRLDERQEIWRRLAHEWRLTELDRLAHRIEMADLSGAVQQIARGDITGRVVVRIGDEA